MTLEQRLALIALELMRHGFKGSVSINKEMVILERRKCGYTLKSRVITYTEILFEFQELVEIQASEILFLII